MGILLTNLCCEKKLTCVKDFNNAIHTDIEVRDFNRQYGGMMNFNKNLEASCKVAYSELPKLTFEERLELVEDGQGEEFENAVKEWKLFIKDTMGPQMFREFFEIMNMQKDKIKTIYLLGEASGGKSAIMNLLSSVYRYSEIGKAGAQAINSNFWLEDLVDKRIAILDEIIATGVNIDALKMLMEGNYFTHTNVKFGRSYQIDAMPVIIACNHSVTRNCQGHHDAVMKRCVMFKFYRPTTRKLYYPRTMLMKIVKKLYYDLKPNLDLETPEEIDEYNQRVFEEVMNSKTADELEQEELHKMFDVEVPE